MKLSFCEQAMLASRKEAFLPTNGIFRKSLLA